ncbi:hypothetical protein [Ornithinimicrobium kibberense]|uniref:hypothetical protein n=1 Tax=Ornithinimicrobium kibberense TaxID=282060 RepID=UPI0036175C90
MLLERPAAAGRGRLGPPDLGLAEDVGEARQHLPRRHPDGCRCGQVDLLVGRRAVERAELDRGDDVVGEDVHVVLGVPGRGVEQDLVLPFLGLRHHGQRLLARHPDPQVEGQGEQLARVLAHLVGVDLPLPLDLPAADVERGAVDLPVREAGLAGAGHQADGLAAGRVAEVGVVARAGRVELRAEVLLDGGHDLLARSGQGDAGDGPRGQLEAVGGRRLPGGVLDGRQGRRRRRGG